MNQISNKNDRILEEKLKINFNKSVSKRRKLNDNNKERQNIDFKTFGVKKLIDNYNYVKHDYTGSENNLFRLYKNHCIKKSFFYEEKNLIETPIENCLKILNNIEKQMIDFFKDSETGRYPFQIRMHNEMLKLVTFKILGYINFEKYKNRICKKRNWEKIPKDCFVIAARKSGKTDALVKGY